MKLLNPLVWCGVLVLIALASLLVTRWGVRLFRWVYVMLTQKVVASEAKLSDFISITSVCLTIVGAILAYAGIAIQAKKSDVEQRSKRFADSITATEAQLQNISTTQIARSTFEPLILIAPSDGISLISPSPYLQWDYVKHNEHTDYRVQVISLSTTLYPGSERTSDACAGRKWSFFATEPAVQRSQVLPCDVAPNAVETPYASGELSPGEYLWRVQPAKLSIDESGQRVMSDLGEWSEFSKFSVFRSLHERVTSTHTVLVGTAYSASPSFVGMDSSSESVGHDIDLIRLLVRGCLTIMPSASRVTYDAVHCGSIAIEYEKACAQSDRNNMRDCSSFLESCDPQKSLCTKLILYSSANDGLEALQRKEIDVFIGSLTRAEPRQNIYNIRFTSGYYSFDSKLYGRHIEHATSIEKWLASEDRTVGVTENSTNEWLANEIASESIEDHTISVVAFKSIPELEAAFDRGDVDGVLLDNISHPNTNGIEEIEGLRSTKAWRTFKNRIGFDGKETFAIAVAAEPNESLNAPCTFEQPWYSRAFVNADNSSSLYCPLQQSIQQIYAGALESALRNKYGISSSNL